MIRPRGDVIVFLRISSALFSPSVSSHTEDNPARGRSFARSLKSFIPNNPTMPKLIIPRLKPKKSIELKKFQKSSLDIKILRIKENYN